MVQRFKSAACIARLHWKCDWGICCLCKCHNGLLRR